MKQPLAGVQGVEPWSKDLESSILPLNYTPHLLNSNIEIQNIIWTFYILFIWIYFGFLISCFGFSLYCIIFLTKKKSLVMFPPSRHLWFQSGLRPPMNLLFAKSWRIGEVWPSLLAHRLETIHRVSVRGICHFGFYYFLRFANNLGNLFSSLFTAFWI